MPVVCFVGPKNSGKTTLLEKVIGELASAGLRVAAVKHDAHEFRIDHEGKDSYRFAAAGAHAVLIASATKCALVERLAEAQTLEALVARHVRDADIVLAEGYKASPFPKVVVHRSATGQPPLRVPAEQLLAIASDAPVASDALAIDLDDAPTVAALLRSLVEGGKETAGAGGRPETEEPR